MATDNVSAILGYMRPTDPPITVQEALDRITRAREQIAAATADLRALCAQLPDRSETALGDVRDEIETGCADIENAAATFLVPQDDGCALGALTRQPELVHLSKDKWDTWRESFNDKRLAVRSTAEEAQP
jgi:hypothetical protein